MSSFGAARHKYANTLFLQMQSQYFANSLPSVTYLQSMDPELYKNLMFLKNYSGSCEDLCLTFTVTDTAFDSSREFELIPGGRDIDVTAANRMRSRSWKVSFKLIKVIRFQACTTFFWSATSTSAESSKGKFKRLFRYGLLKGVSLYS